MWEFFRFLCGCNSIVKISLILLSVMLERTEFLFCIYLEPKLFIHKKFCLDSDFTNSLGNFWRFLLIFICALVIRITYHNFSYPQQLLNYRFLKNTVMSYFLIIFHSEKKKKIYNLKIFSRFSPKKTCFI